MIPTVETVTVGTRLPDGTADPLRLSWYAVQTRPQAERQAIKDMDLHSIESYFPTSREPRRWTDRTQMIDVALFPQYLFTRLDGSAQDRVTVLRSSRVIRILGNPPEPVPDEQIEWIRRVVESGLPISAVPMFHVGQRVRVTHGALKEVEGLLVTVKSQERLAVQVPMLGRSVLVELSARNVEVVKPIGAGRTSADVGSPQVAQAAQAGVR